MLKPVIETALNKQINFEQAASQEYLAMVAYFEQLDLRGFAKFMRKQSEEEREHAMRTFAHIFDRGVQVNTEPHPQPRAARPGRSGAGRGRVAIPPTPRTTSTPSATTANR